MRKREGQRGALKRKRRRGDERQGGLGILPGAKCQRWFIYDAQPPLTFVSRTHFDVARITC